jgi:riboflavin kinase/FMN adenylyltransferase
MHTLYRDAVGPCLAPLGSVVCIGAFDGVHRGHRHVLDRVRDRASSLGLTPVAVSFEPLPREFFARGSVLPRLTSAREKVACLAASGMHRVLSLRFDATLAALPAEQFVDRILVPRTAPREIWVGAAFRFGKGRAGDVALLRTLGARHGFDAAEVSPFELDGTRVSSSRIRELLAAGDFAASASLLGRPFRMGGHVVHGRQLGRKLGYPTANLRLGRRVPPIGGIFAVRVHAASFGVRAGVASLGVRPTVYGTEPLLEAHLFDFDADIYGERIEVEFVKKLRDEEKFPDLDALVRQMDLDAAEARRILRADAEAALRRSVT